MPARGGAAKRPAGAAAAAEAQALVSRRPQLVSAAAWSFVTAALGADPERQAPPPEPWFAGCPRGTTYDFEWRVAPAAVPPREAHLAPFKAISPREYLLSEKYLEARYGRPGTAQGVIDVFGPRLEYDLRALERADWVTDLGEDRTLHRAYRTRRCELRPRDCYLLGDALARAGQDAEAAAAFERGVAGDAD